MQSLVAQPTARATADARSTWDVGNVFAILASPEHPASCCPTALTVLECVLERANAIQRAAFAMTDSLARRAKQHCLPVPVQTDAPVTVCALTTPVSVTRASMDSIVPMLVIQKALDLLVALWIEGEADATMEHVSVNQSGLAKAANSL